MARISNTTDTLIHEAITSPPNPHPRALVSLEVLCLMIVRSVPSSSGRSTVARWCSACVANGYAVRAVAARSLKSRMRQKSYEASVLHAR